MLAKIFVHCAVIITFSGCITRAPSDYELDRRAGLVPSVDEEKLSQEASKLSESEPVDKIPLIPRRSASRIEKIWVYDQVLSPEFYLQGTYVFLEVSPSNWTEVTGEQKK